MIARLIMRSPLGPVIRWLAGVDAVPHRYQPGTGTLDERIAHAAELLIEDGYEPMAALAAAEAVEIGRERGLYFETVKLEDAGLRWWGVYAKGDPGGPMVMLPLPHASQAMQRGIGVLN